MVYHGKNSILTGWSSRKHSCKAINWDQLGTNGTSVIVWTAYSDLAIGGPSVVAATGRVALIRRKQAINADSMLGGDQSNDATASACLTIGRQREHYSGYNVAYCTRHVNIQSQEHVQPGADELSTWIWTWLTPIEVTAAWPCMML